MSYWYEMHNLRSLSLVCYILTCLLVTSIFTKEVHRQLNYQINPGCDLPECKFPNGALNILHVEAVGPNDTVHYLWSTYQLPTIIVAQTSSNAALEIDWEKIVKLQNEALWFTEDPVQSASIILTKLWQYDDSSDHVSMVVNKTFGINLEDFLWSYADVTNNDSIVTSSMTSSNNDTIFSRNGTVKMAFSAGGNSIPSKDYPHLLFNSNSTQMKLILSNLATEGEKYRFAAEFMAIYSSTSNKTWNHKVSDSIDDEHSPGVFKVHDLYPPCEDCEIEKSFLTWKPVAYLGEKPTVANSSDATASTFLESKNIPPSIASMFYNNSLVTKVMWNMTFGTSNDGWYERTKYTSWSVMIGLGDPNTEGLSLLAKIVIGIGLGAPCVIMIGGVIYLIYKKFRKNDDDDELLLAK